MFKQQTLPQKILVSFFIVAILIVINSLVFLSSFERSHEMAVHTISELVDANEADSIIEFYKKTKRTIIITSINSVLVTLILGFLLSRGVKHYEKNSEA